MYQSSEHLFYSQTYFAETLKFTSFSTSDVAEISGAKNASYTVLATGTEEEKRE